MCGIVGIYGHNHVAQDLYDGLIILQHRGQDAAGIMTFDGTQFHLKKGDGMVPFVFNIKNMMRLQGNLGLGHVRYPTAGIYESSEAQPFYVNCPFGMAIVHNGNLTNYDELKNEVLKSNIRHLNTASDSEVLLNVIADEVLKLRTTKLSADQFFRAMAKVYQRVSGGYAVTGMFAGWGMFAFRDPYGIRPLIFGKRTIGLNDEFIFASESVVLDTLGFQIIHDVKPGEAIFIDSKRKIHKKICAEKTNWAPCIFEHVYFARPDSVIDHISVYKARLRMGTKLAYQIKKANLKIDTVIPIPDTSRSAAVPLARILGVKYREGFVKNHYIGRTFIMPGQRIRQKSIYYKLNPVKLEFRRKNVLLVDDSIVRGNTSRQIVEMARGAGAKKVFFASCCPPLKHPCLYGIDMANRKEFAANKLTIKEIQKEIGADALFYQKQPDLLEAVQAGNPKVKGFCMACFDGKYPTKDITEDVLQRVEKAREQAKIAVEAEEATEDQLTLL